MDITHEYYLTQLNREYNKNSWKAKAYRKFIENEISEYRLTAMQHRGTFISRYCNWQANLLEKALRLALS